MKNNFEMRGETTTIFLRRKNGELIEAKIDTKDLSKAQTYTGTWFAYWSELTKSFYVVGNIRRDGKRGIIRLHRLVTDAPDGKEVDHINHDTLDNRQCNLRIVTRAENRQNKSIYRNSKSGIPGVVWYKQTNRWRAEINVNNKKIYLGYFLVLDDAVNAVKRARKEYMPYSLEADHVHR